MLSEVVKLVEVAVNALHKKSELDKQYFDNFVEPIWKAFVRVHEDYKKSFRSYLTFVSHDDCDVEALIEIMRNDSLDTSDLRSELENLIKHLPPAYGKDRREYLQALIEEIQEYFYNPEQRRDMGTKSLLNIRWMGIVKLSRNRNEALCNNTIEWFDEMLRGVQSDFDRVADAYQRLKAEIIS